jgi:2-keto-4-pentenoate hydratase/2-oxohepta-3-ene-1,7-dioic acid hydratase in catechol pathway
MDIAPHSYRLASYVDTAGQARAGLVVDERVIDVATALGGTVDASLASSHASVLGVLQHWSELEPMLRSIARGARERPGSIAAQRLSEVQLLAPVLNPGGIFCAGANFRDHVEEMSKALGLPSEPDPHERGLKPWHFIKASGCVRGTGASIALPSYSKKVDWEAEVALVMGRECRSVGVERALEHVAGLTIANDLSARDHLRRDGIAPESPFRYDWLSQKCFDGALPLGPWITPLDDFEDVGRLGIKLWVNDELMQDSSTSNMIFSMAEQVAHLSTRLTLQPGDVVVTGTPAGCGSARGRFLQPGDRVRIWVEGAGELTNTFTA